MGKNLFHREGRDMSMELTLAFSEQSLRVLQESPAGQHFLHMWKERGHSCQLRDSSILKPETKMLNDNHTIKILLTDQPACIPEAKEQGMCVCGFGIASSFPNADVVFEDVEALSVRYLEMMACHVYGEPYTIGACDSFILRESRMEDFEPLFEMMEEAGIPMFEFESASPIGDVSGRPSEPLETDDKAANDEPDDEPHLEEAKESPPETMKLHRTVNLKKFNMRIAFETYIHSQYKFYGYGLWTLEDGDGEVAGWCGFSQRCEHPDLGYVIEASHRRKHMAFRACTMALDYAKEELGMIRVLLYTDKTNTPSINLAKKLGFKWLSEDAKGCITFSKLL